MAIKGGAGTKTTKKTWPISGISEEAIIRLTADVVELTETYFL
jgi:hypothetical protein